MLKLCNRPLEKEGKKKKEEKEKGRPLSGDYILYTIALLGSPVLVSLESCIYLHVQVSAIALPMGPNLANRIAG
jgi:hypothetical protein